jgi:phospholipid N-methyltransferase
MLKRWFSTLHVFGRELVANPRQVGAACPSSPILAGRIAALVGRQPEGYVIELGAGTGAITHALLEAGVPASRLIPVERSERLATHLQKRFPAVGVHHRDARDLKQLANELARTGDRPVSHVVSSLPLRSLPEADVQHILAAVGQVLGERGLFIQYTYSVRGGNEPAHQLHWCGRSVVWLNLPPARVDVFATQPATAAEFRKNSGWSAPDGNLATAS